MISSTAREHFKKLSLGIIVCAVSMGCSSSKTKYQREYTRIWKEIIKSEAWKNSLLADNSREVPNELPLYASTAEDYIVDDGFTNDLNMEALFEERFQSLVSRAYFKIIAEAEKSDHRIKAEYDRYHSMQQNAELKKDKAFRKEYENVRKKYHAHRNMLNGLKSWNIFSEFRSNDIDFFKAENRNEIHTMYTMGSTEDQMINYLIYRLADLYHDEE